MPTKSASTELPPEGVAVFDKFASDLGMSDSQFIHCLEDEYEQQHPDEKVEFDAVIEQANLVLPEMNASLDRMIKTTKKIAANLRKMGNHIPAMSDRLSRVEEQLVSEGFVPPLADATNAPIRNPQ